MNRILFSQIRTFCHRPAGIAGSEFAHRRNAVLTTKSVAEKDADVAVLVKGAVRQRYAPDVYHPFKQCSYFRYLCGIVVPDSFLYFDKKESVLFVQEVDDHSKLWDGCRYSDADLKRISGVDRVLGLKEFDDFLVKNVQRKHLVFEADDFKSMALIELLITRPQTRLNGLLDKVRWIKSPAEIELMRRTCEIGSEAMNSMIRECRFAKNEAVIAGFLEFEYKRRGTSGAAYAPVVAAGSRANVIHYIDADQDIKAGDCVLVDAGCDLDGYVSDISRNFPISGHFSDSQRTLFDALQAVQADCLRFVHNYRPLKLNKLYFEMVRSMARHFKEAGVLDSTISNDHALEICDKLCPHHVSHYLGMDVHDTASIPRNIEMEPGVVFTVEPGVYVRDGIAHVRKEFFGIGYRIEDDVLLTKTGAEVLTEKCVHGSAEIEKLMNDS